MVSSKDQSKNQYQTQQQYQTTVEGVCELSTLFPLELYLLITQPTDTQSYISKQPRRSGLSGLWPGILSMGKHSDKAMQLLWKTVAAYSAFLPTVSVL